MFTTTDLKNIDYMSFISVASKKLDIQPTMTKTSYICQAMESFVLLWNPIWLPSDLGEPTHTLILCWMSIPLPPKNESMDCFTPAVAIP